MQQSNNFNVIKSNFPLEDHQSNFFGIATQTFLLKNDDDDVLILYKSVSLSNNACVFKIFCIIFIL